MTPRPRLLLLQVCATMQHASMAVMAVLAILAMASTGEWALHH